MISTVSLNVCGHDSHVKLSYFVTSAMSLSPYKRTYIYIYRRFFLLQSKFYTTSNRSTSGCRKDDTWTVLSSRRTAAVLWTCRTFTVDLPFPVRRYRWHILMRILSSFHKSINLPIRMLGYQRGSYKLRTGHGLQTWYSDSMAILSPLYNLVLHCLLF